MTIYPHNNERSFFRAIFDILIEQITTSLLIQLDGFE